MTPRFIDYLEEKFKFLQIVNLPMYIVFGQGILYLAVISNSINDTDIILKGANVLSGDLVGIFPLLLYPFSPPLTSNYIGLFFTLYITFLISRFLEDSLGSFKLTLYIFTSYLVIVATCFIFPNHKILTQWHFYASLFIAFAYITPNFVFHLFFLFPIKVKWLSLFIWMLLIFSFIDAKNGVNRMQVISAVLPFVIFFGKDIFVRLKQKQKRVEYASIVKEVVGKGRHKCIECNKTELTDPELDFRYKEVDDDLICYCVEHMPKT